MYKEAEDHLSETDPIMKNLVDEHGPCTLSPHKDYYRELLDSIISQQLSVKAATTIFGRFIDLFEGKTPTPQQILHENHDNIRAVGCSNAKVRYIKDLAQHIVDGRLNLDIVAKLPNEQIIEKLTDVKGIGEWSAHMFMIFSLGRTDVLPTGDLGVRKGIMHLYKLKSLPTPTDMQHISTNNGWAPYESIASWYIWRSLDSA